MSRATFLDGATPTQLRGLLFLSLSEVGHVVTETFVSDNGGGGSVSSSAGTAVPCRIDPLGVRGGADVTGGRIDERSTHVVTLPPNTAIGTGSQFAIDGRGTFNVTALRKRTRESARTVEVVEV